MPSNFGCARRFSCVEACSNRPIDERLGAWAHHIEKLQWSAIVLDSEWRFVWASSEMAEFIGEDDGDKLGYGKHIAEAFLSDVWLRTVHPDSQVELFNHLAPYLLHDFARRGRDPKDVLPESFLPLLEGIEPTDPPAMDSISFAYVNPSSDEDLPDYRVNGLFLRLNDDAGELIGWLCVFFMDIRPNLLVLLARGDEQMYERMAKLVDPGPRQAAIMFCDLHGSGTLSRRLPSAAYFKLVRRLWRGIDAAVAEHSGIVGKHAGDGASAFFLVDDLGSPSAAAAAAIRAAARVHEISHGVFEDALESDCLMKVGLHWGGSLYMGQLVPGGRLDVTALGDEVNEAARIQETAGAGETLASKQLVEQLTTDEAAALGVDVEKLSYRPLAEIEGVPEKAARDAGGLAVTNQLGH
ncbi:MAG TPA: adenylate/guanylate cyclase domain-containing protein [Actinomycetota bacterium]|nr:adenylate/guanylate cyclase domain-containing protein [Actinomycetota bacterium]